jgi:hypothetical protein
MDFRMKYMQNPIKTQILTFFARFTPGNGKNRAGEPDGFAAIN